MTNEQPLRAQAGTLALEVKRPQKPETLRRHVLNRTMQEKSGRLYCNEDWDIEIPSLELYAAR
jgi:hypothetical protein